MVKIFSLSFLIGALDRLSIQFTERIAEGTGKNSYKGLKVTVTKGCLSHLTNLRIVKKNVRSSGAQPVRSGYKYLLRTTNVFRC